MRQWEVAPMRLRMVILVCLLVWSGIALSGAGHPAKSEVLMNDTGLVAYGLRVTFDKPVSVTGKGEAFTRWVTQEDGAVLLFGEGEVGVWGDFYFYWEPEDAAILSYEWLSQPPKSEEIGLSHPASRDGRFRGVNLAFGLVQEELLRLLAEDWNANLVRVCLNFHWNQEDFLITESDPYCYKAEDLVKLDHFIDVCERFGLRVIIEPHQFIGYRYFGESGFLDKGDYRLWSDFKFHDHLIRFWKEVARRYADRGEVIYGYDLLNEPHELEPEEGTPSDWNLLAKRITDAIREVDTQHAIIVESINYASATAFKELKPTGDPNTIYSFHFYRPFTFTHQGRYGLPTRVSYPGTIGGRFYDKATLREDLQEVLRFKQRYQVPILVGEFSACAWAPSESRRRYLTDLMELFEEYGFDWCVWGHEAASWSLEHEAVDVGWGWGPHREAVMYVGETQALTAVKQFLARNTSKVIHNQLPKLPNGILDESHWGINPQSDPTTYEILTWRASELAWRAGGLCDLRRLEKRPISPQELTGEHLLILFCPDSVFTSEEVTAITSFVSGGGGLLVVLDEDLSTDINDVLFPFGITFERGRILRENSNGASYDFWVKNLDQVHEVTSGVSEFELVKSASLRAVAPGVVLAFTGTDTWRDTNRNKRRDPEELMGPFGIIAAAEYGKGRVVVMADDEQSR